MATRVERVFETAPNSYPGGIRVILKAHKTMIFQKNQLPDTDI
jgi:hypothetical protein